MAVDEVEAIAVAELDPRRKHVGVHALDPGDELAEVGRSGRLAHAMDVHATGNLLLRRLLAAAREHMHLDLLGEVLGELSHVPCEPAFDQRRVLPGEDQNSVHGVGKQSGVWFGGSSSALRLRSGARLRRPPWGGCACEFMASSRASACSVERRYG